MVVRSPLRFLGFAACIAFFLLITANVRDYPVTAAVVTKHWKELSSYHGHDILDNIANRTLGFQKIFVIVLPHRTDQKDVLTLAASLTGLDIEFVDGVLGGNVSRKALPPGGAESDLNDGSLGAWRAHMDVAQRIVAENIQSALVMEADIDWDIRIKAQMRQFAQASRLLVQPLKGTTDAYLDPTIPYPEPDAVSSSFEISDEHTSQTREPTTSPYGDLDQWDLLWLGHCGCQFPWVEDETLPLGRVIISDDETVPERQHYQPELGDIELPSVYADHTRVVSRARLNSCSLAYAYSAPGARKFLYELGIAQLDAPADTMMRFVCDGNRGQSHQATCLTVQPQLFQTHRPRGSRASHSDINDHDGFNPHAETPNIRWSTKINLDKLVAGDTTEFRDLYPDGEQGTKWVEDKEETEQEPDIQYDHYYTPDAVEDGDGFTRLNWPDEVLWPEDHEMT